MNLFCYQTRFFFSHLFIDENIGSRLFCAGLGGRCRDRCAVGHLLLGSDAIRSLLLVIRGWDGDHLFLCFIVTQLVRILIFWPSATRKKTPEKGKSCVMNGNRKRIFREVRKSHEMNILKLFLPPLSRFQLNDFFLLPLLPQNELVEFLISALNWFLIASL